MNAQRQRVALVWFAFGAVLIARSAETEAPIDWQRARELHRKDVQGQTLTTDERAYLNRAMAERRAKSGGADRPNNGQKNAGDGDGATQPPRDHTGLVPLTELGAEKAYHDREGGLYGGGHNDPPAGHLKAALAAAARIVPLDAEGKQSPTGKIGLLSIGMSNTTQEFSRFKEIADRDPAKAPQVVLVDGAQGGQAAAQWAASADNNVWRTVMNRLRAANLTPAQVQVAWLKQAEIRPTEPFPQDAEKLAADLVTIIGMAKRTFPNLRIVYLSSRIYAGYATTSLNPEPYAYDGGFAVRDVIQRQIDADPALNFDAARGTAKAPVLLWGPYLWADGMTPRKADGLVWKREDLREDGTHPSAGSGRDKVAKLLLDFLKTDPTAKPWFVKP